MNESNPMAQFLEEEYGSNITLSSILCELQLLIQTETEYWFQCDKSRTSDKILRYDQAFDLLIGFVIDKDVKSFLVVFEQYDVTIANIRKCFRLSKSSDNIQVKTRRNKACKLFACICKIMITILQHITVLSNYDANDFFKREYNDSITVIKDEDESSFTQ
jgi:hypothetical protein